MKIRKLVSIPPLSLSLCSSLALRLLIFISLALSHVLYVCMCAGGGWQVSRAQNLQQPDWASDLGSQVSFPSPRS